MNRITYTINDPITGDTEEFDKKLDAMKAARQKAYTPVFIDVYDNEEHDIKTDIRVDIPGAQFIK